MLGLLALGLTACLRPELTQCPTVECPKHMVCDGLGGCATPEQISQCASQADGTECRYATLLGTQVDGACEQGVCRNQQVPACLFDLFLDSRIDRGMWELWLPANEPVVVAEEAGWLDIRLAPNVGRVYNGLQSRGRYDMLEGNASIEVVPASQEVGVETTFSVDVDSSLGYEISAYANRLHFVVHSSGGVTNSLAIDFDPAAHRFWRIRHDPGGTMELETSADGVAWISRRSAALPRLPTAVIVSMLAGTYLDRGVSEPGVASFYSVKLTSGSCP
jgi:hypothetical protein